MHLSLRVLVTAAAFAASNALENIVQTGINAGSFETLVAALGAADLVDTLSGDGPFTVFAPTDDAFAALPGGLVDCLLLPESKDALTDILTFHVVGAQVKSDQLSDGQVAKALNEGNLTFTVSDAGAVTVNDKNVTMADVMATNGVIHVIDGVMVPPDIDVAAFLKQCPNNIVGIGAADENFETLVAALGAADLVDTLSGDGPFTVFAPTDDAFAALPDGLVDCLVLPESKDALTDILTFHVVGAKVTSGDLSDGQVAKALNEDDLTFTVSDAGAVTVNDKKVTMADVMATNGVIHVIDGVMVPPDIDVAAFLKQCPNNIVGIGAADGNFETLVAALGAADLVDTLSGEGPFTVFAPTDDAFAALPQELAACLLKPENKSVLVDILTFHVVGAKVTSGDLSDGQVAEAVNGDDLTFTVSDAGAVTVNDKKVTTADVMATNGVIHVIDGVLVPPGIDVDAFLKECNPPKTASPTVTPSTKPSMKTNDSDDSAASASNSFVGMFVFLMLAAIQLF